MFQKIMVCSDSSKEALEAVSVAADLAQKYSSKIELVCVYDPVLVPPPYAGMVDGVFETSLNYGALADETLANSEREASVILHQAGVAFTVHRELGHPVDRITASAKDLGVNLIVLGSRGLGGFERVLLGSVSEGVLHHAHCAVLIVR